MSESAQTTVEKEQAESPLLFQREGVPALKDLLPCSLQHVLACFAGAIAPAMMIASTCHFTEAQETGIIQVALILTALDTFLQQFPLFGRIGSNLPILTGVSFAFLPAFQAIGFEFGFGTLLGAELVGGVVAILFGVFFKNVTSSSRRWSPVPSSSPSASRSTRRPSSTWPAAWAPRSSAPSRAGSSAW